ncbi:subtilisin-like protease [Exidia glandulosa HHB12029]|uniref:Subtilisin-like protease n=1 Tax=Exidia glandulosa HHB12029 TaxID=1314781 RepID=A0A165JXN2_EXIGL|nr:subtilisin-like protease [Exidia glandulosa HHB12029]
MLRKVSSHVSQHLHRRGVDFQLHKEWNSDIFTGAVIELAQLQDVAHLHTIPQVRSVRRVTVYDGPKVVHGFVPDGPSDPKLPGGDRQSTHVMLGVDKARERGLTGKGIRIGVIDTGVDYTHPLLGGKFGPGHKIAGGRDLVGDSFTGQNAREPDDNPIDQCNGHGTHVAGVIAANPGDAFGFSGIAPDSTIFAYRIFGCGNSSAPDDVIIDALLAAHKDDCQVITLSLGSPDGWSSSATSVVASRLAAEGRVVTIAAGNRGAAGAFYSFAPANGEGVISVASVDNSEALYRAFMLQGVQHDPMAYVFSGGLLPVHVNGSFPLYAVSNDTSVEGDACSPLPESTPDLSGYATIVRRGGCSYAQKQRNVAARGGKVVIFYNNGGVFASGNFVNATTAVLVQDADGAYLVDQFVKGVSVSVRFPDTDSLTAVHSETGGLLSEFTTFGPTNDMHFKPSIAAPGKNILSIMPVNLGGYLVGRGTSMACPHVPAAAALILQAKGATASVGKSIRSLLQTTAAVVHSSKTDETLLQTVAQQGAGLLNVYNAIFYETTVSPSEILLNDTANWRSEHAITITNAGVAEKTYRLTHVPAGTALALKEGRILPEVYPVPLIDAPAVVHIDKETVVVGPGRSVEVKITIRPPDSLDPRRLPILSGFIQVASADEMLHVSYLGLGASLRDAQIIDPTSLQLLDAAKKEHDGSEVYTLRDGDAPTVKFKLAMGTQSLRVDLVASSVDVWHIQQIVLHGKDTFAAVPTVGPIVDATFVSRNWDETEGLHGARSSETLTLPSHFLDGTPIQPGEYRMLLRALKITGDPAKEEDREIYITPSFQVVSSK